MSLFRISALAGAVALCLPVEVNAGTACLLGFSPGAAGDCIYRVMFVPQPNPSLSKLRKELPPKKLALATAAQLTAAWEQLKFESAGYGMLDDGSFAAPVQEARGNVPRGLNQKPAKAVPKRDKAGYFAVVAIGLDQARSASPAKREVVVVTPSGGGAAEAPTTGTLLLGGTPVAGSARCLATGNLMAGGWTGPYAPLLREAARLLFERKGMADSAENAASLAYSLNSDPVAIWEFSPFVLKVAWDALIAPSPSVAQQAFRKEFERYVPCDQNQIDQGTLVEWKQHIGERVDNGLSMAPPPTYPPTTLTLLLDTGPKIGDFLPRPNPLMLGDRGLAATAILYQPMVAFNTPGFDDKEQVRMLGEEMARTAAAVGAGSGVGTAAALTLAIGTVPVARSIQIADAVIAFNANRTTAAAEVADQAFRATMRANGMTEAAIEARLAKLAQQAAARAAERAAQAAASKAAAQAAGVIGEAAGGDGARFAGLKLVSILGRQVAPKIISSATGPVLSGVAFAAEVLGEMIAEFVKTSEYDAALRKGASTITPLNVSNYLADKNEAKRIVLFTELVKMLILDPADQGLLDIQLPHRNCFAGYKKAALGGDCVKEVYFEPLPNATKAQARAICDSRFWDLAAGREVETAWERLQLNVTQRGLLADGRLAVPIQNAAAGLQAGANVIAAGNVPADGFFYTIRTVEYHQEPGLDLEQARILAGSYGGRLATADEVGHSWETQGLNVYAYGRMADGHFAVPVQKDTGQFRRGPNIGSDGGNQGFFFVRLFPRALVDTDRYYRGQQPLGCAGDMVMDAGLCYPACQAGYRGVATRCYSDCPSGWRDDGLYCAKPVPYGREGFAWQIGDPLLPDYSGPTRRCEQKYGAGKCEQWGAMIYPKCNPGFHAAACCICTPDCPAGMGDIGVSCSKGFYDRGVGKVIDTCATGYERIGALCYPLCRAGYNGTLDWCYAQ